MKFLCVAFVKKSFLFFSVLLLFLSTSFYDAESRPMLNITNAM